MIRGAFSEVEKANIEMADIDIHMCKMVNLNVYTVGNMKKQMR